MSIIAILALVDDVWGYFGEACGYGRTRRYSPFIGNNIDTQLRTMSSPTTDDKSNEQQHHSDWNADK